MVTTSKLENERMDKLRNLSDKELGEYIEKLVLDVYKGFTGSAIINDNPEMEAAIDKLDEITNITMQRFPTSNIKEVIKDRKFRYMNLAYLSAVYKLENLRITFMEYINFTTDIAKLEMFYAELKSLLRIYYETYSNYGFMEDLLMDLSDDGLAVDSDIHEKYTKNKEYRFNQHTMDYLDIEIKVIVKIIMDEIAELDKKYLPGDAADEINECIDSIHSSIKDFYKNNSDFEIAAYKQCGLLDANMDSIESIKKDSNKNSKFYMNLRNEVLEFINTENGFAELSADEFERYKKRNPDADFTEWIKKQPKYNVKEAKFIYPLNIEC